jgi:transcription antitermination factor NusG
MDTNWKALYVNSRSEKKVCDSLLQLGLEAYVPLIKERRKWSDRVKVVATPLIHGYVFLRVKIHRRDDVFRVAGVVQYVKNNGVDAIISDKEISVLREIELKGYSAEAVASERFMRGEKAVIRHGRFKGMTGTVERHENKEVYMLTLDSIG